ncbi:hypothetical protein Vau01_089010 [Virgisporangium aurantiacum]|uniref:DNA mismatch repair protein MutL n=1 Tax=Virgisporangium aurantiacum TaxID=175570 RepID=A0A8J3ZGX4_9ACTN|nr:hypothetical protein Vau01_089010 [Virgisporangium aurantiacum]
MLGWCAATLASVALASVALLPVLRTGTPSADDTAAEFAAAPIGPEPTSVALPPGSASPSTAPPSSRPPASRSPKAPPPSQPVRVVDGWTVTTNPDGETVYVRSFRVDGGQAVIQMTEGRVDLVTATPSPGYTVQTVQNEPGNLAVQFTEQNHYYIIHALWHNNAPFAQVSEVGG